MGYVNSPSPDRHSKSEETALKRLRKLSLQFLRGTQEFLEAQKPAYTAHKACDIYLGKTGKAYHAKCRRILQMRLELNPGQLHNFFRTSLGNDLLAWIEQFVQLSIHKSSEGSLRDLLLQMAADPEGLSLLKLLHRPDTIQLNLDQLLFTAKRVQMLLQATTEALEAVCELAASESHPDASVNFSTLLDARQPGPFAVRQYRLTVEKTARSPLAEPTSNSHAQVFCYQPDPLPEGLVPVIIQSHGLASGPEDAAAHAEHLASYGYFVAAPKHSGSDAEQVRNMLAGHVEEVFSLSEFVDRPHAISDLLDELERRNSEEFEGRLNLNSVGMMGYSFGGYTAFALAGAGIHFDTLELACDTAARKPNISLLLQCQALGLPRQTYQFCDRRIGAVLSIDAVGSEVLGSEGMQNIQIPVLLVAGNQDIAAPLMLEQIRMFQWLTSAHHYLALIRGKSHIQDIQKLVSNLDLQIKLSPPLPLTSETTPFEQYIKALSVAFFNQHLVRCANSIPPLSADYANYISRTPFDLWLISQASTQKFKQKLQTLENI